MKKFTEVETAKTLMNEAMTWSVMRWLREKKRVRKTADTANAVLDQASLAVKSQWPQDVRLAYEALAKANGNSKAHNSQEQPPVGINSPALLTARQVKAADDEAYRARMDAEDTFDEAERQLSTRLAREGCGKAIHAWDLHEKAIRKAETLTNGK